MPRLRSFDFCLPGLMGDDHRGRGGALCAVIAMAVAGTGPLQAQVAARQGANLRANAELSMALIRLNRNPRDTEALIAAGDAALATGDTDAAVGFFTRADSFSPNNPRVQAGLAGAKVRAEDPFSAIPLFIAAERNGPIAPDLLGDRGLAYDLVGDNATAQRYYRQALATQGATNVSAGAYAEISRRLALSLAIGGDRQASETVLSALLQKQDRAAWRARIFALAILGYEEEAVATARSTMPADLALQIAPYLRYMRRLTAAQQAAAANLGHFPQASQIGQDDPRIAQYARTGDRSRLGSAVAGTDRALVPAGAPLGGASSRSVVVGPLPSDHAALDKAAGDKAAGDKAAGDKAASKRRKDRNQDNALVTAAAAAARPGQPSPSNPAPPELLVSRETQPAVPGLLASAPQTPVVQALPVRRPAPVTTPSVQTTTPSVQIMTPPAQTITPRAQTLPPRAQTVTLLPPAPAPLAPAKTPIAPARTPLALTTAPFAPATSPAPHSAQAAPGSVAPLLAPSAPRPHVAEPRTRPSFSDAFAAMSPVVVDITPERGAVDLRRIAPARDVPRTPLPPPPSHPSRIWVELGVGRDTDRIAFDWRRMVKDDPEIFQGKKPFVTSWARTNRLLVGPFETDRLANAFTEKLHKADHPSAFVWTSPAGQVVDPLDQ